MTANSNKKLSNYLETLKILEKVSNRHVQISDNHLVAITEAVGGICAENVFSEINVPSFNNSAMDGFAVKAEVINSQIESDSKARVKVSGQIQAGDKSDIKANNHSEFAWEIMTGAPVPSIYDSVIPIEQVTIETNGEIKELEIQKPVTQGQNVRLAGTDYIKGQLVVAKHTQIQSQHVMALATIGCSEVSIIKPIPVAIFSTGNELTDKSKDKLESGKIFNSNQPFLQSYLKTINCEPVVVASCHDIESEFEDLLDQAKHKGVKIIFSTGAVSMGRYDFIPRVLKSKGATIHFHKAKVRPGKPILFAELPDGTIYFGLPGNPIAAASGVRFFATPFIRTMIGLNEEPKIQAKLMADIHKKLGFRTFAKAKACLSTVGQLQVEMLVGQGSFQTHSFAQSNCWLVLEEDQEFVSAGEVVNILPMVPGALTI